MPFSTVCYADTVHNALYVSGYHPVIVNDSTYYMPFYRYRNGTWDLIGKFDFGIQNAVVYRDTLIACGYFQSVDGTPTRRIAYYDGSHWHAYGSIGPAQGAGAAIVYRLRVIDDVLYALGKFDEVDGQPCQGMLKRVGGHWEPLGPPLELNLEPGFVDITKFQGNLVVGGNFYTTDWSIKDLMQLNGGSWEPICDCLHSGFDNVNNLAVYKGELYVGGSINKSGGPAGNVGEGVIRWDGTTWRAIGMPGGGLQHYDGMDSYCPIRVVQVIDDLLFIAGDFDFADHLPVNSMATWDGERFCRLDGNPGLLVSAMDEYQDTLFVSVGGFDGPAPNYLTKYLGESYQAECNAVGVEEATLPQDQFTAIPEGRNTIRLLGLKDGAHGVMVWDVQGRLVLSTTVQSQAGRTNPVHTGELNAALYVVSVDQRRVSRFVPAE